MRRFLCVHWRFLNCVNGKSYGRSEIVCFVCAVSVFLHIVTLRPFTLYPQRIQRTHVDCISTSLLQSARLCVRICWYFVSCVNEVPIRKDVNTEAKAPVLKVEHFQLIQEKLNGIKVPPKWRCGKYWILDRMTFSTSIFTVRLFVSNISTFIRAAQTNRVAVNLQLLLAPESRVSRRPLLGFY